MSNSKRRVGTRDDVISRMGGGTVGNNEQTMHSFYSIPVKEEGQKAPVIAISRGG